MIEYVAGFVLWMNSTEPQVYLDTKRYTTYEECKSGGSELFNELKKTMNANDKLIGECFSFSKNKDEDFIKQFFKDKLKTKLREDNKNSEV